MQAPPQQEIPVVAHALADNRRAGEATDRVGLVAEPRVRPCSGTAWFRGAVYTSSCQCTFPGDKPAAVNGVPFRAIITL